LTPGSITCQTYFEKDKERIEQVEVEGAAGERGLRGENRN
jgi:hypothetical protein